MGHTVFHKLYEKNRMLFVTPYVTYRMLFVNCWINGIKRCYPRCRKRYCQRQDGSLRVEQYELFRISNWISFNWSIVSIFIFCQTNHAFAQFFRAQEELKTFTLTQSLWLIILTVFFQTSNLSSIGRQGHDPVSVGPPYFPAFLKWNKRIVKIINYTLCGFKQAVLALIYR